MAQVTSIFISSSHSKYPVIENNVELQFDIVAPQTTYRQTVDYRVIGTTAEAGIDFIAKSGTFVFGPDHFFHRFTIQLLDDRNFEALEQFVIELFNPEPLAIIGSPTTTITIQDDERGYASEWSLDTNENSPFVEVPIHRHGDIDFASTVEAYLEPDTAEPGVDYIDESFIINFAPNETVQNIRVKLINNSIEDGNRFFRVRLRNPTGGIPIGQQGPGVVQIVDNELGYTFRNSSVEITYPELYEGSPEGLVLERQGDYDVQSVAVVRITESVAPPWEKVPATPDVDFQAAEFQIEFAPGQTSAEVPLVIVNDTEPETGEWIGLAHTVSLSDPALAESTLSLRDNEFNPLPVLPLCLEIDPVYWFYTPLADGKFLLAHGDELNNSFNYTIYRFTEDGALDASFTPMVLDGRPTRIVEGADGKYTALVLRSIESGLHRFESDGRLDTSFQPFSVQIIRDFEVANSGAVYVNSSDKLFRLHPNGTIDSSFTERTTFGDTIVLGSNGSLYFFSFFGWERLTETGAIDPGFSLPDGFDGQLHEMRGGMYTTEYIDHSSYPYFFRLTDTGAIDPDFTPIPGGWTMEQDIEGRFYRFTPTIDGTSVDRFEADGTPDHSYFRGTIDVSIAGALGVMKLEPNGRSLMVLLSAFDSGMNGVPIECQGMTTRVSRIELDPVTPRTLAQPGTTLLRERPTGDPDVLTLIRTGENESAATVFYRIRPGSAIPGVHYALAAEGEARFDAGVSRVRIPITILDNSTPELDRNFFVDLLNETGEVSSTIELIIRNDDVGLQILSREGKTWRILPISGELPLMYLMKSTDFEHWEYLSNWTPGVPFEIELSGDLGFIQGAAWP